VGTENVLGRGKDECEEKYRDERGMGIFLERGGEKSEQDRTVYNGLSWI